MGFIVDVIYVSLSRRCDVISMQIAFVSLYTRYSLRAMERSMSEELHKATEIF